MNLHRLPPPWRVFETTALYGRKMVTAAEYCVASLMNLETLDEKKLIICDTRSQESLGLTMIPQTRLYFLSKNTDIHWRRRWPGNWMENLAYGNGVLLLVPEDNDQTQEYAVIEVLNVGS
jgi:hypothetical protein